MSLPDVHVEIALETDPLTRPGDVDWTRIDTTCGLRELSTRRGAGLRDGTLVTGTATARLDNRTGDLLPENTGGAWYPDLTLRKRIRFMKDGTDPLFTGFIDRLPVQWDKSGSDGLVELEAVDLLALLAQIELPPSVLHQTIMDLDPVAYWPLTETQGTRVADLVGTSDLTLNRPVSGSAIVAPFVAQPSIDFKRPDDNDPRGTKASLIGITTPSSLTIAVALRTTGDYAKPVLVKFHNTTATDNISIGLFSQGALFAIANGTAAGEGAALVQTANGSTNPLDKVPHRFVVTIDGSTGAVGFWWDGEPVSIPLSGTQDFSAVDLAGLAATLDRIEVGWGTTSSSSEVNNAGAVGHVAYWDSVLSDAEIAVDYAAWASAWEGDTTGARLERILDAVGVDDDDRDIDTGIFTCGPTQLGGNALEYLRKIAATERGALFVSADGKITFQQQYANDPTPLDVIGDAGCPYSDITVDYSLDRMVNQAEVTAENGISHTFKDSTAVTAFGPLGVNRETLHSSPSGAKSLAAELVVRNKDLRTQVVGVELESRRADVPSAVSVDTEIGDPYTISYEPPGVGSAQTVLVRVESISHRFTPGTWTTRFDVDQQVVLPDFQLDTAGAGADQAVLAS